jgi:hypothetical protein
VEVYSSNMEKIWSKKAKINLGPNTSKNVFRAEIPAELKEDIYYVELQLLDNKNKLVSENFYWLAENDDLTSLSALPKLKLKVEIEKKETNQRILGKIQLINSSDNLAFFVNTSICKGSEGGEVLPSFWSDNYFSILPGNTKELKVEFQKSDLGGEEAFLKLDGWNIVTQLIRME